LAIYGMDGSQSVEKVTVIKEWNRIWIS